MQNLILQKSLLLVLFLALIGCQKPPEKREVEKSRPVQVQEVALVEKPVLLRYIGRVASESIKKYSFKVGGRISAVRVKKGDHIQKGQPLARLETQDYTLAASAAELTSKQAEDVFQDAKRTFEKVKRLYEAGARPEKDFEQARLAFDVRRSMFEQSRLDVTHKKRTVSDTVLRAGSDGFVVMTRGEKGELIGPGHPLVIVRDQQQVVRVGVSQRDLHVLSKGSKAMVDVDGVEVAGEILTIEQVPDQQSQTYQVDVALTGASADQVFYLGALARVAFDAGARTGIWIPAPAILTEGVQFVYLVEGDRAVRRTVTVGEVSGAFVEVMGLKPGDNVIVEGMKNLKEGFKVEVVS